MNSYLIIVVKGRNINKFLHRCKDNNINIINIKNISHKESIIKIYEKDYDKLNKVRSVYKLEIINSGGLLKFKELINKNKILLMLSFLGIVFLIFLSNIIFSVQIIGNNIALNRKIYKELESYGIKKYQFKKSYNEIKKIKGNILNDFKDTVEWIEITNFGTKYEVKIVERKKNKVEANDEYVNIVSRKSGIIRKIYAESGQKQIELNTYVNKGDVIISGTIMKGEDVKKYVHAKGKVYAEIWYNVTVEFPLNYTEKKYTNKNARRLYIKLNDKYISLNKYDNFERKSVKSLKNGLVPFEIGIENQQEVKIINDKYSINDAKVKAVESAKKKVLQNLDNDEYIIDEKILKFNEKNSKIVLYMFFTCFEEIGKEEKFTPDQSNNEQ